MFMHVPESLYIRAPFSTASTGIWDATEGELHLTNVGSNAYPDYELAWEGNMMMHAVAAGEPA